MSVEIKELFFKNKIPFRREFVVNIISSILSSSSIQCFNVSIIHFRIKKNDSHTKMHLSSAVYSQL